MSVDADQNAKIIDVIDNAVAVIAEAVSRIEADAPLLLELEDSDPALEALAGRAAAAFMHAETLTARASKSLQPLRRYAMHNVRQCGGAVATGDGVVRLRFRQFRDGGSEWLELDR